MTRASDAPDASAPRRSRADDAVAGVVAGAACVAAGHPFDTVKVFVQKNRGHTTGSAIAALYRARGARGLYAGRRGAPGRGVARDGGELRVLSRGARGGARGRERRGARARGWRRARSRAPSREGS